MYMAITEIEQRIYEDKVRLLNEMDLENWAKESFTDKQFRLVFIKALNNLIEAPSPIEISEASLLDDQQYTKQVLVELLRNVITVSASTTVKNKPSLRVRGIKSKEFKGYTTGELATYFGVSTNTINNWINKEGRFLKYNANGQMEVVKRDVPNEKLRIHPEYWFDSPSGMRYQVKELVETYELDKAEWDASKEQNMKSEEEQIVAFLEHFKKKYKGQDFNAVFGKKNWNQLNSEEETDAAMWSFFLQRLKDDKNSWD